MATATIARPTDIAVRTCVIRIRGTSPISGNAEVTRANPKRDDETHDQHEERTWRFRLNTDSKGRGIIPGVGFTNSLIAAARFLNLIIPGKGKSTYAKLMEKCVIPNGDGALDVTRDEVEGEWLHVPSNGRKGGGSRVWKCFPIVREWETVFELTVVGKELTEEVMERIATAAGRFIGLGRFRPQNGGFYGRFEVVEIEWRDEI